MWTTLTETRWLARTASNGLFRGPTILQGNNAGDQNTPGAAVQNAWLAGLLNRHLTGDDMVPEDARIAFVSGMFVGGVRSGGQASMILVDFWDGVSAQPNPAVWPGDQGSIYSAVALPGEQIRQPFGVLPVPVAQINGAPLIWFRWGTTGDRVNKLGYNLWLQGWGR